MTVMTVMMVMMMMMMMMAMMMMKMIVMMMMMMVMMMMFRWLRPSTIEIWYHTCRCHRPTVLKDDCLTSAEWNEIYNETPTVSSNQLCSWQLARKDVYYRYKHSTNCKTHHREHASVTWCVSTGWVLRRQKWSANASKPDIYFASTMGRKLLRVTWLTNRAKEILGSWNHKRHNIPAIQVPLKVTATPVNV